jgi:hypothetical protein
MSAECWLLAGEHRTQQQRALKIKTNKMRREKIETNTILPYF